MQLQQQQPPQAQVPSQHKSDRLGIMPLLLSCSSAATANFVAVTCRQIAAQTNTMILAGYETTANTLAFSIYLLARNPDTQQRLLQEVDQFAGRPGYDDLQHFPYSAAVINEALRLYPPATMLTRVATEDVQVGSLCMHIILLCCHHHHCSTSHALLQ